MRIGAKMMIQSEKDKLIVILAEVKEQADFFLRFQKAASLLGYRIIFLTIRYSVYRYIRHRCQHRNEVVFLSRKFIKNEVDVPDLSNDIEFKVEKNKKKLCDVYRAVWGFGDTIPKTVSYIFLVNGCKIADHAFQDIAKKYNIATLFFELANIPGKTFADPQGTNAKAALYTHKEILQSRSINRECYESWKKNYIQNKLQEQTVKQANVSGLKGAYCSWFEDVIGAFFYRGVEPRRISLARVKTRLRKLLMPQINEEISVLPDKYLLFPLQVSEDTQILIHARKGLEESLEEAIQIAKEKELWLIIKPHPVEPYPSYLRKIIQSSHYNKVVVTHMNTFRLIMSATSVFTINSTVGLEALILNKPLIVVGKALYENFSDSDVENYIEGYLLDIDFWGNTPITNEQFSLCLKRASKDIA